MKLILQPHPTLSQYSDSICAGCAIDEYAKPFNTYRLVDKTSVQI